MDNKIPFITINTDGSLEQHTVTEYTPLQVLQTLEMVAAAMRQILADIRITVVEGASDDTRE
jgi:hypothetical protein